MAAGQDAPLAENHYQIYVCAGERHKGGRGEGGPGGKLGDKGAMGTGTSRGVGVGISRQLLLEGATVVGCSRSELPTLPAATDVPGGAERSAQWVCDQGDYQAIDGFASRVV